jgi:hypothetical protein
MFVIAEVAVLLAVLDGIRSLSPVLRPPGKCNGPGGDNIILASTARRA